MSYFSGAPVDFNRSRSRHHGHGLSGQTEVLTTGPRMFDDGNRHHSRYRDRDDGYHDRDDDYNQYPDAVTTTGRIINVDDGHHKSRRRHRHRRRQEPQVITTSGTQVLTTSGNNVIPAGATVINADTGRNHQRRRRSRSHRYYDPERPSSFHGFCNRIFGALTGNNRRRRYGRREMRDASAIRKAKHVAQDVRENGHKNKLQKFHRHSNRHHRQRSDDPIVIQQDGGHNGRRPWMHHHRTPTAYSGYGNLVLGYLTGNRDRRNIGSAMLVAAREQRGIERDRRRNSNYDAARGYHLRR